MARLRCRRRRRRPGRLHDREVGRQGRRARPDDREAPGDRLPRQVRRGHIDHVARQRWHQARLPRASRGRSRAPRSWRRTGRRSTSTRSTRGTRSGSSSTGCSSTSSWRTTPSRPARTCMLKTSARRRHQGRRDKVKGVKVKSFGETWDIKCGCVVAADGYESNIGRWAGINTNLAPRDITSCFQYRLTNISHDPDYCEFILGSQGPWRVHLDLPEERGHGQRRHRDAALEAEGPRGRQEVPRQVHPGRPEAEEGQGRSRWSAGRSRYARP